MDLRGEVWFYLSGASELQRRSTSSFQQFLESQRDPAIIQLIQQVKLPTDWYYSLKNEIIVIIEIHIYRIFHVHFQHILCFPINLAQPANLPPMENFPVLCMRKPRLLPPFVVFSLL